ncbi:hypothetical protein HYX19_02515 [Candidatus Woesearchaeota archaeon]|nr:hypothetical protein [Candidatus Woesearchaeota archaeon]
MIKRVVYLALFIILFSSIVISHGESNEVSEVAELNLNYVYLGFSLILLLALVSVIFNRNLKVFHKRILFYSIISVTILVTLYLLGITLYWNIASESNGPVHWHADFEIFVCGEKKMLPMSEGLLNRIGTSSFHHHNDYRIHIEGIVVELNEVDLGHFFKAIGGEFTKDTLSVPKKDGSVETWKNRDKCPNGEVGKVALYVNGKYNDKLNEYVISPYQDVPPGDRLKIVFE